MSAFAGIVRRDGAPADPDTAQRLADALAAYGPDGTGWIVSGTAALAGARFVTTPHAPPARPSTLDGAVWCLFAGRLDARDALHRALRAAGHPASPGADDAELVLRAHAAWGDDAPSHLLGDFSFAVWDAPRHRLLLARDALGVKPLYVTETARELIFSTAFPIVRAFAGDETWDEGYLADYLLFSGAQDRESTVLRAVRRLPAGHRRVMVGDASRTERWWTPEPGPARPFRGVPEAVEAFSEVLREAVADRTAGLADVAILMSGGMDSTGVAAFASGGGARLSAHTMAWDPLLPSRERHFAARAAAALRIPNDVVEGADVPMFAGWDDPAFPLPHPIDNALLAVDDALNRSAAAHARVALTGFGGDAVLVESVGRLAQLILARHWADALTEGAAFARWHGRIPRPGFRTLRRYGQPTDPGPLPAWLETGFARRTDAADRWIEGHRPPATDGHPRRPEAWHRIHLAGWQGIFEEMDPAWTGVPLEMRHPLFDLRVMDFCLSVPPAAWYNDKALLRLATRGRLPRDVLRRGKAPLPGDPYEARLRRDGAGWLGGRRIHAALDGIVDVGQVPRWAGGGADAPVERAWLHLRPLTFSGWIGR